MSTTQTPPKASPSVDHLFILSVKEGNYVNTYNIIAEDLQAAVLMGKKYCENLGQRRRFIHVRPFTTDLERKVVEDAKNT
jgi:hypothetical protein